MSVNFQVNGTPAQEPRWQRAARVLDAVGQTHTGDLARERERAREIREAKERELAREREQAAKDRQTAEATAKEKKDTAITYNKEAAKQKTADVSGGMPTYKQPKAEQ